MKFSAHNILSIIALLPLVWSCSGGGDGDEPVPGPDCREPVCELTIRVGAVHSSSPQKAPSRVADLFNIASASPSRAIDGDFETPEFVYENIHTLRTIILRPDRSVEVNTMLQYSGNRDVESYVYLVKANEKKKIYLFVNEPKDLENALNLYMASTDDGKGPEMPKDYLENLVLKCDAGKAYIDNTGKADGGGTWVPMSEFFDDIDTSVPDGQADAVYHKTVDLFVTRTPIKFSFNFSKGPGYNTEVPYVVEGIRISNMAGAEYYLPRNTVYNPDKYSPSTNPFEGRYITSFTSPAQAEPYHQPYTFTPSPALEVGNTTLSYNPAIYLPESAASDYTVDIKVRDKNSILPAQWLGAKPLPAPDNSNGGHIPAFLPRNTHVIVNITLDNPYNFSATVTVEPYKQVVLKPEFGFDPPEDNNH